MANKKYRIMNINWKEFEIGKKLLGSKAILLGGGQLANAFIVVDVIAYNQKTGQIKVNDGTTLREPYIMSWYLRPIHNELMDLPLGDYIYGLGEIPEIRKQDGGIFGTIYNCTIVKKMINDKWSDAN